MFNIERAEYKKRVLEAILDSKNPEPKVMSIIIDAMDNNKCRCPYTGSQKTFDKAIPQVVMGVKEHGVVCK